MEHPSGADLRRRGGGGCRHRTADAPVGPASPNSRPPAGVVFAGTGAADRPLAASAHSRRAGGRSFSSGSGRSRGGAGAAGHGPGGSYAAVGACSRRGSVSRRPGDSGSACLPHLTKSCGSGAVSGGRDSLSPLSDHRAPALFPESPALGPACIGPSPVGPIPGPDGPGPPSAPAAGAAGPGLPHADGTAASGAAAAPGNGKAADGPVDPAP